MPRADRLFTLEGWLIYLGLGAVLIIGVPALNAVPEGSPLLPDYLMPLLGKYASFALLALALDLVWASPAS